MQLPRNCSEDGAAEDAEHAAIRQRNVLRDGRGAAVRRA